MILADYNLTLIETKLSDRRSRSSEFVYYKNDGKQLHKDDVATVWSNIEPNSMAE